MVDVRAYIDALKITWLRRLYKANQSSDWSTLCNHIFGITRLLLLEGGLAKCVGTQRIYNNFWLDVFNRGLILLGSTYPQLQWRY